MKRFCEKALIILSLRYKTNDHFWFTLYHEAGHLLLHSKKDIYIDNLTGFESKEEEEADRFAGNYLLPSKQFCQFISHKSFDRKDILSFSKMICIHPGIIVGRLQHEGRVPFNVMNELKERLELTKDF